MARFYKVAFELIKCHNVPSLRIKRGEISVFEVKVQDGKIHPLSAIFFAKKMANEDVSLLFTVPSGTTSLKTEGFLPCHGVMK